MILHSYWRSTTSYRVRIALNLKELDYELRTVDLVKGEHKEAAFLDLNPSSGVPVLELVSGVRIAQSLAIIDYLEQIQPEPALLPHDPVQRALALEAAQIIALDIHPVNNLKVVNKLKSEFAADADAVKVWMQDWMRVGFAALEAKLPEEGSFTSSPGLVESCLVAQLYNAHRWGVDLSPYPKIQAIEAACTNHPAFVKAHPDNQPDSQTG